MWVFLWKEGYNNKCFRILLSTRDWKKNIEITSCCKRSELKILRNGHFSPLIRCFHSTFQFKIHRTRNSRTTNWNFKEGHLNSRTFQGKFHFKEFSRRIQNSRSFQGLWEPWRQVFPQGNMKALSFSVHKLMARNGFLWKDRWTDIQTGWFLYTPKPRLGGDGKGTPADIETQQDSNK